MILKLKFCCFMQDSRTTQQSASMKNSAPHVRLRVSSQSIPGKSLSLSSRFAFSPSRLAYIALFSRSPVSVMLRLFIVSSVVSIEPIFLRASVFRCSVKM